MNPLPPNTDELVSAYLDGEAAPDEVAMVEASPELMTRVEELRAVSTQLSAPIAPPPAQKEAHLAAALSAFDDMFAGAAAEPADATSAPILAAVPTPAAPPVETAPATPTVTSLDAARERRKPRRFNVGVIAAAVAALLLIAGFAVLSGGRGGDDVATSATDGVSADAALNSAAADEAAPAEETFDSDADLDQEEAMDDEESADAGVAGGLSDADESRDSVAVPTAGVPSAAAPSESAAEGDAAEEAMDDEEAMEDDEAADAEQDFAAEQSSDSATPDFLGEFDTIDDLVAELDQRAGGGSLFGAEIFEFSQSFSCQAEIPQLFDNDTAAIVGNALVGIDGRTPNEVEIYLAVDDSGDSIVYIVDSSECSILSTTPGEG